jgi:hypothetical protein
MPGVEHVPKAIFDWGLKAWVMTFNRRSNAEQILNCKKDDGKNFEVIKECFKRVINTDH